MNNEARDQLIAEGLSAIDRGALGLVTDPEWGEVVAKLVAALSSRPVTVSDEELLATYNEAHRDAYEIGASEGLEFSARAVFGHMEGLRAVLALVSPAAVPDEETAAEWAIQYACPEHADLCVGERCCCSDKHTHAALSTSKGNTPT